MGRGSNHPRVGGVTVNEYRIGDCLTVLRSLPDGFANTCVTSPPYWGLRDYGHDGQIGLEETPDAYVERMVAVFREVRRVLRDDGTLWLNLGDSYAGGSSSGTVNNETSTLGCGKATQAAAASVVHARKHGLKPKDLVGIPWRVAFALQADGWYLRSDIIWHKPNPMPESVKDRCTKAHEYIFLLSKNNKYYYDNEAIKEPTVTKDNSIRARDITKLNNTPGRTKMGGLKTNNYDKRNKRSVWTVTTKPYKGAHFAVFPPDLIEPCILAGSEEGDIILDPFMGSGTTAMVAKTLGRDYIGCELHEEYGELIQKRIDDMPIPEATLFD